VFDYTPAQAFAFASFARARIRRSKADMLLISAIGSRGKGDDVKNQLRDWSGE
jgi:hypothetical protein